MSNGYTVSPVTDDQGNIVDFNVDDGYSGFRSNQEDIVEFTDGTRHHVFEDAQLREDGEFTTDSYYETLAASDERIPAALQWAAGNLPPELITEYNESLDNDDVDTTHRILEYILENYPGDEYNDPDEEYTEDDTDYTEEEIAAIEEAITDLQGSEAQGDHVADEWVSVAEQAESMGDATYAAIAKATALFHSGQAEAEELINHILSNYDMADVARVYQSIVNR
jgi:hypothetical protein